MNVQANMLYGFDLTPPQYGFYGQQTIGYGDNGRGWNGYREGELKHPLDTPSETAQHTL